MSAASLPKVSFSIDDHPKNNFNSDKKLYNFQRNDNNLSNNKSSNNFSSKLFKSGDTRPGRSLPPLNNSNGGGNMGGVVP